MKCTAHIGHKRFRWSFCSLQVNMWELSFWMINFRSIANYFLGAYALNNWNITNKHAFSTFLMILLWSLWLENQTNHKIHQNHQFLSWKYEVVFLHIFLNHGASDLKCTCCEQWYALSDHFGADWLPGVFLKWFRSWNVGARTLKTKHIWASILKW